MNAKIIAALAIMAAFASLGSPVRAQSPEAPAVNTENYQLTGDSLEGVGTRTAQDDFTKFFDGTNSGSRSINNGENNITPDGFRLNEPISLPDTQIILQPAQSMNGNDGVQVQLDLGNE
ncbi:hypothetical protein VB735_27515 [Halotia wernerae UHCC 0503]|nr:hypothetical protein [Halotia wernerae UHCC 0503]